MPLRPIDLQVLMPKISSTHHAKQTVVNHQNALLQDHQIRQQQADVKQRQTVQTISRADALTIRDENQRQQKRKKNRDKQSHDDDNPDEPHLDIII